MSAFTFSCSPATLSRTRAFGLFDGLHYGNMLCSNGQESFTQMSKDGALNSKSASALFSGEGNLLPRSATSNVACNTLINGISGGIQLQSDAIVLGALSADTAPTTTGFLAESDLDLPSQGFSSIPEAIVDLQKGKVVLHVEVYQVLPPSHDK